MAGRLSLDQLAREFDVWLLVFADWHKIRVAEGDVCRLADRIADEAVGHVVVAVLRSFGLDRWVVAQGVHRDEHGIEDRQLGDGWDLALQEERHLFRIETNREVVDGDLHDAVADQLWTLKVGRQRLDVGDLNEGVVVVLQFHTVGQTAHIVTNVETTSWTVASEDAFHSHKSTPFSKALGARHILSVHNI